MSSFLNNAGEGGEGIETIIPVADMDLLEDKIMESVVMINRQIIFGF